MDFAESAVVTRFRADIRAFIADTVTAGVREKMERTGTHHDWSVHRGIAGRGWLAAALPESLGGQGRDPEQLSALFEELETAGAPFDGASNVMMLAYILARIGSEQQRAEILPRLLDGSDIVCLGYSEPGSGSDVAAARTRALPRDGGWLIDGQKMFTSVAEEATWAFLLARTDTGVAKHRGLTFFLVDMDAPGVDVRELRTLSGKRTNVTFYQDVFVPDDQRVGEVDGGWDVMRVALAFERGFAGGVSGGRRLYADALAHARTHGLTGDPAVRTQLARLAIDNEVAQLLAGRAAWVAARGELPGQEGAECKLFATEAHTRAGAALLDVLGPDALRRGAVEHSFRLAPVTTVWGGTSEIQKNLIAERGLGLPRRR